MSLIISTNRPTLLVSERTGGTNMGIWASSANIERVSFGNRGQPRRVRVAFLRNGGATALTAGGSVSKRVVQREGRWKSDAYRIYTRNNLEDSENVSRRLASSDREREYKTTRPVTALG